MTSRSRSPVVHAGKAPRVVVVDVGNSSTSVGIYHAGHILTQERIPTGDLTVRKAKATITQLAGGLPIDGAALASVAPRVNDVIVKAVRQSVNVPTMCVHHGQKLGAAITYPDPETIGADRLANLAGAVARYSAPVIVVDIGTATTFDIIQPRKGYTGGVIAPGPALMLEYLAEKTALLPRIDLTPIRQSVGKSTEQAMRIGALHGYRGMVRAIALHLMRHMKNKRITLCATGGYARWVLKGMDLPFIYDRDLTLFGVGQIFELNRGRKSNDRNPN